MCPVRLRERASCFVKNVMMGDATGDDGEE